MSILESVIDQAFEDRANFSPKDANTEIKEAIEEVIAKNQ